MSIRCTRAERHDARQYPLHNLVAGIWYVIAVKDARGFWVPQPGPVDYDAARAAADVGLLSMCSQYHRKPGATNRRIELVVQLTSLAKRSGFGGVKTKTLS